MTHHCTFTTETAPPFRAWVDVVVERFTPDDGTEPRDVKFVKHGTEPRNVKTATEPHAHDVKYVKTATEPHVHGVKYVETATEPHAHDVTYVETV